MNVPGGKQLEKAGKNVFNFKSITTMNYKSLLTPLRRLMMLTAVGVFLNCQSSDLDLYFVDHQEQDDFITLIFLKL